MALDLLRLQLHGHPPKDILGRLMPPGLWQLAPMNHTEVRAVAMAHVVLEPSRKSNLQGDSLQARAETLQNGNALSKVKHQVTALIGWAHSLPKPKPCIINASTCGSIEIEAQGPAKHSLFFTWQSGQAESRWS